jgi:prevent-host-death family protein
MTMDMTMVHYEPRINQGRRIMTDTTDKSGESRTIKASEFKATCLRLMDEVAKSGEEIVITKNGRPTARLLPYRKRFGDWFGADRDRIEITGDIISPIDVEWEAEVDPDRVLSP